LKTTFNEKVCELRTRKIKLIREYIQFKFDVNIIQKELNDPEIITPLDFPQVLIDESIDVKNILYSVYNYYCKIINCKLLCYYTILLFTQS